MVKYMPQKTDCYVLGNRGRTAQHVRQEVASELRSIACLVHTGEAASVAQQNTQADGTAAVSCKHVMLCLYNHLAMTYTRCKSWLQSG